MNWLFFPQIRKACIFLVNLGTCIFSLTHQVKLNHLLVCHLYILQFAVLFIITQTAITCPPHSTWCVAPPTCHVFSLWYFKTGRKISSTCMSLCLKVRPHNSFLQAEGTESRNTNCRNSLSRYILAVTSTGFARPTSTVMVLTIHPTEKKGWGHASCS